MNNNDNNLIRQIVIYPFEFGIAWELLRLHLGVHLRV